MDAEAATYWLGWLRVAQLVAVFLVAVGVVAEFAGEWISRPLEKIIDDARELEIARLSAEAESARAAIASADARAAEAGRKAAEADLARIKLEQQLAPRWIWPEHQEAIREKLRSFPKMIAHLWIYPAGTADIFPLAMLLEGIMSGVGWETARWSSLSGHPSVGGVLITWRAGTAANEMAAKALRDGLMNAGIHAVAPGAFEKDDKTTGPQGEPAVPPAAGVPINPPDIMIFVGTKP